MVHNKRFTDIDSINAITNAYSLGETSKSIAVKFGTTANTILRVVRESGIKVRTKSEVQQKYQINENAFLIPSKARDYWSGFIAADGCVHKNSLSISLQMNDKVHLEKLKSFLSSNHPLIFRKDRKTFDLFITNKRMVKSLSEIGILERKTFTFVPNEQQRNSVDFWRGMIDGDGSFAIRNRSGKRPFPTIRLFGNYEVVKAFETWCKTICSTKANTYPHSSIWVFGVEYNYAQQIAQALYDDAPVYLDRKYQTYLRHRS